MSGSDLRAQLTLSLGAAYIIDRELPGRGMSRVFVAHEERADRDVVIKVLSEELTRGLDAEQFLRIMRRSAKLNERHTLPVLVAGVTATGLFYYVAPFVPGESLRQHMQEDAVGFDESVAVLRDVARSLAYGHAQGLIHRNLKPEKVLLAKSGAAVTDFGVAMALEAAKTVPGGVTRGTPAYMAPEHITADPGADYRADIYAWGVMAYELLAHAHPFAPLTGHEELMEAHVSDEPPMLMYKRFGVPEQFANLVMRCLSKDPDERPSSAAELLTVLDRIPDKNSTVALESARGARWIGGAIIVAVLLFIITASAVWRMQSRDVVEPPRVAVLPFEATGDSPDTVLATGMADNMSFKLGVIPGLRVIERRSVFSAAAEANSAEAAGDLLHADYVVTSAMTWNRDGMGRVQAVLTPSIVRVTDGATTWEGAPIIVHPGNPFPAQDTLVLRVATAIGVPVSAADSAAVRVHATRDTAAFAAFTRGNLLYRRTRDTGIDPEALTAFERAYTIDPRYADALASAGAALLRMWQKGGHIENADSIVTLLRRALAIDRTHARALTTLARVALSREHPEDARTWVDRAVTAHPSDIEALELRPSISLLAGDSAATWHDVELITLLAPQSADAFVIAASHAQAIRRFRHAGRLLQRARLLEPERLDLILDVARLARADGDFPAMARAVRMFRVRGGTLTAPDLTLLRVGDPTMQRELASATPDMYAVHSSSDSVSFYMQRAELFLALHRASRARPLLDSSATILSRLVADTSFGSTQRRRFSEVLAWTNAARGERARAVASMMEIDRAPFMQDWPSGQQAAITACNGAEVYALLDDVDLMIPLLRRCLTLPGGYATSAFVSEPA
ncbi:MAG: protein kinase, partial [Gemmatimonadaceae bacterium]